MILSLPSSEVIAFFSVERRCNRSRESRRSDYGEGLRRGREDPVRRESHAAKEQRTPSQEIVVMRITVFSDYV